MNTYKLGSHGGGPSLSQTLFQSQRPIWVFNGEILTITEFAQRVYGDTPQRTEFLLKYSQTEDKVMLR